MPISRGLREILGVFGPMLDAALEFGRGAAQMWAALTAAYEALGVERPHYATLQDMNDFRGYLGGFVTSVQELAVAADEDVIARPLWTYPVGYVASAADFANPSMLATFESQIETEGGPVTRWSSILYSTFLPATVGQLREEAQASVQEQLDTSASEEGEESPTAGGQVVGLGRMYITARGL